MKQLMVISRPHLGQSSGANSCLCVTSSYKSELVMADFDECKKDNEICYSPHFYTHPNGYKICLEVLANGYGVSKDIHLSVFMCLM